MKVQFSIWENHFKSGKIYGSKITEREKIRTENCSREVKFIGLLPFYSFHIPVTPLPAHPQMITLLLILWRKQKQWERIFIGCHDHNYQATRLSANHSVFTRVIIEKLSGFLSKTNDSTAAVDPISAIIQRQLFSNCPLCLLNHQFLTFHFNISFPSQTNVLICTRNSRRKERLKEGRKGRRGRKNKKERIKKKSFKFHMCYHHAFLFSL